MSNKTDNNDSWMIKVIFVITITTCIFTCSTARKIELIQSQFENAQWQKDMDRILKNNP